eukprot:TRINITY_DN3692_c0_g1_i2.p2 TRINITY_DN3692_c0_g1~~TRINITY_DN3692_c0_g1_i2.p2  ORF type:complete len:81 (+),score=12.07 TRINITY_DN3692_c0_g1_i2:32-244(+)
MIQQQPTLLDNLMGGGGAAPGQPQPASGFSFLQEQPPSTSTGAFTTNVSAATTAANVSTTNSTTPFLCWS